MKLQLSSLPIFHTLSSKNIIEIVYQHLQFMRCISSLDSSFQLCPQLLPTLQFLSLLPTSSVPYICWVQKAECSVPVLQVKAAPARQPLTLSCWTGCTCTPLLFMSYTDLLKSHSFGDASHTVFPLITKCFVRVLNGLVAYAIP